MQTDRLLLGRLPDDHAGRFGLRTDRHLVTVAPAGTGKSVSVLVPNLLANTASAVVTDPKGELAAVTAAARERMGHRVVYLNPWGMHNLPGDGFNPLDFIPANSPDLLSDLEAVADAIALPPEGSNADPHWHIESRALILAMLLHIATAAPAPMRNLVTLRRWLRSAPDDLEALLQKIAASKAAGGLVGEAGRRVVQKAEKERSGVFSSAHGHTDWLSSAAVERTLLRSTFDPRELKRQPMTVYIMLPAWELAAQGRWLRLIVAQLIRALQRTPGRPAQPVTFYLDEAAALGRLDTVRDAYGLMRGYGMRLWTFWQDMSQLKRLYGEGWETILANSGVAQFFGIADLATAQLVSRMLGRSTVVAEGFNIGHKGGLGDLADASGHGDSFGAVARDLIAPDEVRGLPAEREILMVQGAPPFLLRKIDYLRDPEFRGLYGANPQHMAA